MIRWGRNNGTPGPAKETTPNGTKYCAWHRGWAGGTFGVPRYAQGKDFRQPGCPECDRKLADGKVTKDAPTPSELFAQHKDSIAKAFKSKAGIKTMPRREVA